MSKLSRRNFLKASALSAAALASAGMLAAPRAKAEETTKWDMAADLVVVGGGCGQFGAIAGALAGMSVIILERRSSFGGAMAFSGGNAWLANTEFSQALGDSYENAKAYLDHMQMGMDNEEIVDAYLRNTQKVIDICKQAGIGIQPLPRSGSYQPEWKGAQNKGGRSCQILNLETGTVDTSEAGGRRLNNALTNACKKLGVTMLTNVRGKTLITKRENSDALPEIIGLTATDKANNELRIKANKGVILATGGFEWDKELIQNYLRVPMPVGAAISWPENDGDTVRMVQAVGAKLSQMNQIFGMPFFVAHADYAREHQVMASMAANAARQNSGSIIVDANGRRFAREDSGYMSLVNAFGGYNNFGDQGYTANPAWWICDQASYDKHNGVNGTVLSWGYPDPNLPEEDYVYKADTFEDLAQKIGINVNQFVRTMEEYNLFAAEGKDPLFHRGETEAIAGVGIPPVEPIQNPPYYAVAICAGVVGTYGGPKLNRHAQVIHASGEPIKGLYAMGNCAGVGGPGPSYGGEGGTIGPAFTFGAIAAQHAASRTDVTDTDFYAFDPNAADTIELSENEYIGTGVGINGQVRLKVTIIEGKITAIKVIEENETPDIGGKVYEPMIASIIAAQSTDVDIIAGATVTCNAIFAAVKDALAQAAAK